MNAERNIAQHKTRGGVQTSPNGALTWHFLLRSLGSLLGLGGTAVGTVYVKKIEPRWLNVKRLPLSLSNLPSAFDGYTIAQISDPHLDGWMSRAHLRRVIDVVLDLKPDLAVVTGDFVTNKINEKIYTTLVEEFARLRGSDGGIAILGNHDYWTPDIRAAVEKSGLTLLLNAHHVIRRGPDALYIAGVEDTLLGLHDLDATLDGIPNSAPVVLLAHEPDYADEVAADGRVNVQLSGHTHGGQVRLPFMGSIALGEKYPQGYYQVEKMHLYTNVGVGMTGLRLRFLCRPEVTLVTLAAG